MLHDVYAWVRRHPLVADGLLALLLLAGSADQLRISPLSAALAALAVNVLMAATVVVRRRVPVAAFAAAALLGAAQLTFGVQPSGGVPPVRALEPTVTDLAIAVLLYTLAAYRPRRISLAGLAVCLLGAAVVIGRWAPVHAADSGGLLLLAGAALGATVLTAWVLGDSMAYRRAYYVSLEDRLAVAERARELQETRARAVDESAARLRRIERDLHDGAQVRLAALAMTLGEIKENLAPGDHMLALVGAAHQNAKDTLAELRDLARGIHPPVLDRGLGPALAILAGTSAIPVRLADATSSAWPPPTATTVASSPPSGTWSLRLAVPLRPRSALATCSHGAAGGGCLLTADQPPEHQSADDLENTHDDEPDAEERGQDGQRGSRGGRDHDPGDEAHHAEGDPPSPSFAGTACGSSQNRGQALHDPGDAHQQAYGRNGQIQMADHDDADDDKQQAGQAQPYPVRFAGAEYADQVKDPREDHEDAD
jgi:signal transduction histidine kinase